MTPRRRLATFGARGQLVRLYVEERGGVKRYVVQYGPKGARKQESFAYNKAGKAEAEAFFNAFGKELEAPAKRAPLTNRELWTAYITAEGEHLRQRSVRLYADSWRTWEQFAGAHNIAEATTVLQIAEFRKALDAQGLATATVYNVIRNIRIVFNWGERMELLDRNRWHLYVFKVAKERRTKPRAEYRSDEFLRIWGALDPSTRGQWRAWVAIGLLGIYGNRQNEILNLQWSWITGDAVRIPSEYVKTGEEGTLTLFPLTRQVLDVARDWAGKEGYSGPHVLFPGRSHNREPHYTIQSLTAALHAAERRAGVEQIRWRAGHGFRRGLVGDLVDATGDVTLALQAIRDRDIRMATRYRVRRNDRIDEAVRGRAERLVPEGATKVQPSAPGNENGPEKEPLTSKGDT
jgi:integrase